MYPLFILYPADQYQHEEGMTLSLMGSRNFVSLSPSLTILEFHFPVRTAVGGGEGYAFVSIWMGEEGGGLSQYIM